MDGKAKIQGYMDDDYEDYPHAYTIEDDSQNQIIDPSVIDSFANGMQQRFYMQNGGGGGFQSEGVNNAVGTS